MVPRFLVPAVLGLALVACSDGGADAPASGGAGGGGSAATGGAESTGGSRAGGGTTGRGGSATGGARTGGVTGTGGSARSGGITSAGGSTGAGGTVSTGGTQGGGGGAGGSVPTGGSATTGGSGSGGARAGGNTAAGGAAGSGGAARTGGVTGSGGGASTGGSSSACTSPAPAGTPVATHGQLEVVGTKIQNESGQDVQLKGMSSFWLNWEEPRYAESKAAVQYMRDNWKIQIIRVAMGIEVDDGYLSTKAATQARVDTIVQNAHALGLYVIVDWHTEHAVDQTNESVAFFTAMADKYGKCPNIIYEDYNEPTNVTWDRIKPYHETVVKAIRAKDPDNLIILGTPDWSSKPDVAAANPVAGTNLLYTLHFYSCAHGASARAAGDTAMSKGVALFISEFGLTPADGGVPPNNKVCEAEANLWFDWMASKGIAGTAWKLVSGVDSSNIFSSSSKPPVDGPFPDSVLSQTNGSSPGHGQAIVNWLRK